MFVKSGHEIIARRIRESLKATERHSARFGKINFGLYASGIISGAAATLVAGMAALSGPVVGQGTTGWQITCLIAAVFGFIATLSTGFSGPAIERNTQSKLCYGRLKSLDVSVATGSRTWDEITQEYEDITREYANLV